MTGRGERPDVLTFDCYGTLIDWTGGILGDLRALRSRACPPVSEEEFFAAYVEEEAAVEECSWRPYREVLGDAVARLGRRFGFPAGAEERGLLPAGLPGWKPFPDTGPALVEFRRSHRLGILSNVDRDLLEATCRQFPVTFDFMVTAEDVRSYKPARPHFERGLEAAGVERGRILHVAQSLRHDIIPCVALGIPCVWVNRRGETLPQGLRVPVVRDLAGLVDRLAAPA